MLLSDLLKESLDTATLDTEQVCLFYGVKDSWAIFVNDFNISELNIGESFFELVCFIEASMKYRPHLCFCLLDLVADNE
ncbi:hypothetical protein BN996_03430 [Haloferax massiliensis]|uniref:Uncharacterized protein n=1 Tax=Haloferax massiliensis TaxID=1476858 RepID=A0A0D6JVI4_9EURY|nr:hypothetical protein BN996_03430 [Haloferax massiliensis]